MDTGEFYDRREWRNLQDRTELEAVAERLRGNLIRSTYEGMKLFLAAQTDDIDEWAADGYLAGRIIEHTVVEGLLDLPFENDEPRKSISIRLEQDKALMPKAEDTAEDAEDEIEPHILVSMPVPNNLVFDEHLDIDALPMPEFVVFDLHLANGANASCKISKQEVVTFAHLGEDGVEVMPEDTDADEFYMDDLSRRVNTHIPLVGQLSEYLTNWTAVPQFTYITEVPGQTDFFKNHGPNE